MLRRWGAGLLGLACLLPQAALALHSHEHDEHASCACSPGPAFECDGTDCGSREHHHHERAHDPATCRTCTSDVAPILETPVLELVTFVDSCDIAERALPEPRRLVLWHSGRGPPA